MISNTELFNNWAKNYEKDIIKFQNQYPFAGYFKIIEKIQRIINDKTSCHLLDIGVGTGFMLSELLKAKEFNYYGCDFSPEMVKHSKERLTRDTIFEWDIRKKTLPKEVHHVKMDYVLSAFTLHHFDVGQKIEIINNFSKLLEKNGKFIIADISFDDMETMQEIKQKEGIRWDKDEEEGYFLKDNFLEELKKLGLYDVHYEKMSYCTGIYILSV